MSALFRAAMVAAATSAALAQTPNVLTREEKAAGFELLFNGQDLSGWHLSTVNVTDVPWADISMILYL